MLYDLPVGMLQSHDLVLACMSRETGDPSAIPIVDPAIAPVPGYYQLEHLSGDMILYGKNSDLSYPAFNRTDRTGGVLQFADQTDLSDDDIDANINPDGEEWFNCYGVCDTPTEFIGKYHRMLADDPRPLVVFFTHIAKCPENRGNGGGWRWHKWGPYVGAGEPTREYLDDEALFEDGVFVYHVHQVDETHVALWKAYAERDEYKRKYEELIGIAADGDKAISQEQFISLAQELLNIPSN